MYKSVTRLFCFEVLSSGFVLNEHLSFKEKEEKGENPYSVLSLIDQSEAKMIVTWLPRLFSRAVNASGLLLL